MTEECKVLKDSLSAKVAEAVEVARVTFSKIFELDAMLQDWYVKNMPKDDEDREYRGTLQGVKMWRVSCCIANATMLTENTEYRKRLIKKIESNVKNNNFSAEEISKQINTIDNHIKEMKIIHDMAKVNYERFEEVLPCEHFDMVERLNKAADSHLKSQDSKFKGLMALTCFIPLTDLKSMM